MYQKSGFAKFRLHALIYLVGDIRNVVGVECSQGSHYEISRKLFKNDYWLTRKRALSAMEETLLKRNDMCLTTEMVKKSDTYVTAIKKTAALQDHKVLVKTGTCTSMLAIEACLKLLYHTNRKRSYDCHVNVFHHTEEPGSQIAEDGLRRLLLLLFEELKNWTSTKCTIAHKITISSIGILMRSTSTFNVEKSRGVCRDSISYRTRIHVENSCAPNTTFSKSYPAQQCYDFQQRNIS